MHGFDGFWGGGWMMIVWWAMIILGIIALAKWFMSQNAGSNRSESPLDILKKRYASGEISREEFKKQKADLLEK